MDTEKEKTKKKKQRNLVFFGHESWNLVLNIMLGIQKAVRSTSDPGSIQLTKRDFRVKYVFDLIPRKTQNDSKSYNIFTFIDYAPSAFYNIRQ